MCVCARVNALPIGRGFTSKWLDIGARDRGCGDRRACRGCGVTFEPRQVALGAWQEVKGEAMSVVRSRGPYGWTEADDGLKRVWLR